MKSKVLDDRIATKWSGRVHVLATSPDSISGIRYGCDLDIEEGDDAVFLR